MRRAARHDDRRRAARGRRPGRRARALVPPNDPSALAIADRPAARRRRACGPASARPAGTACSTASPGGSPPKARSRTGTRCSNERGARRDADGRLRPARPAARRAPARHGLRRRPPRVRGDAPRRDASSRSTTPRPSSRTCAASSARCSRPARSRRAPSGAPSTATRSTCRSPTTSFDVIVASEVLEHLWDDRVGDGRARARAAPGRSDRGDGADASCPSASAGRSTATTTTPPAATCASSSAHDLEEGSSAPGSCSPVTTTRTRSTRPYWWLRCAGGVNNPDRFLARHYHDLLVKQITDNPGVARRDRPRAQPRPRQEPRRLRRAFGDAAA